MAEWGAIPNNGRETTRTGETSKRKKEEKPGLSSRRLRGANSDVSNSNEVVWTSGEIICEGKPTHPTTVPHTAQQFECTACHTDDTGESSKLFEHERGLEKSRARPRTKL